MYRTSSRPAPLDLFHPSRTTSDLDRRRDSGISYNAAYLGRNGLQTPPADDMAATYPHSQYYEHPSRRDAGYQGNGANAHNYSTSNMPRPYATLPPLEPTSSLRTEVQRSQPSYSRPQSPIHISGGGSQAAAQEHARGKSGASDMIRPSLQIPPTISSDGGSLPDFAAQITCLFWFENIETLHKAEGLTSSSSPAKRLREEAIPSIGFRKWVVTILSTTQVTDKVIILALLFIYRLKTYNSAVKGRTGSEYRLLTIALMLGNKFLDDNTYTNKTWAEVSGISVSEIHVMEVEFLSNMRYSLLASSDQWAEWHEKLRSFKNYCDLATKAPAPAPAPQVSPLTAPILPLPMPSPPESMQSSPPQGLAGYQSAPNSNPWASAPPLVPVSSLLPVPETGYLGHPRKRSFDGDAEEPVAKRVTRPSVTTSTSYPAMRPEAPRLPVPNLSISTNHPPMNQGYGAGPNGSQILLPPLGSRAISTIYSSQPTTPSSWAPSVPMLTPSGAQSNGYSTPSRRQSPHSVQDLLSYTSSPINANFPLHNQGHISPSVFLQQRSSPYKPIRQPQYLLRPPPSASLHDYSVNSNQMHYQPLGKRNDYRSGIVPDYASHTPYQNWPVLRQPNFHA